MDEEPNELADIISAIMGHRAQDGVLDNLCHIVGILMMRQGVEELIITDAELAALSAKYDGRGLDIEPKGEYIRVTLGKHADDVQEGTHFIN